MKACFVLLLVALLISACEEKPCCGPSPAVAQVSVSAAPVERLVDNGWADINDRRYRMELEGDSLVVRDLEFPPGDVVIEVSAVDDNGTDLLSGGAIGEVAIDSAAVLIRIPLTPARPDLVLAGFSTSPEDPVAGELVTIRVDVTNDGSGSSGPTSLTVRVGAEAQGESFEVPAMASGEALHFDRVVEFSQAGVYQVLAFVDPQNRVPEVINTNNAVIGVITVRSSP